MGMINDTARDLMLDELFSNITHISVHSAWSTTGSDEASGGSYARQAITWGTASGGEISNTTAETFTLASFTARWWGLWSASSGGTFYALAAVGATMSMVAAADATNDRIYADSHGLAEDATVAIVPADGSSTMPGGLTAGTVYYAVNVTTDSFQVAASAGGSVIDITTAAEVIITDIDPAVFGSSADLDLAASALTYKAI